MATIDFENIDSDSTDNKYLDLCKKGRYIEAVKVYKDDTGCGLAEAKAYRYAPDRPSHPYAAQRKRHG